MGPHGAPVIEKRSKPFSRVSVTTTPFAAVSVLVLATLTVKVTSSSRKRWSGPVLFTARLAPLGPGPGPGPGPAVTVTGAQDGPLLALLGSGLDVVTRAQL